MKNKPLSSLIIRYLLFFLIIISLIVIGLWIIAISEETMKDAIESSLRTETLSIKITGLKKGLFYSLSIDRVELKGKNGSLFYIEDVSGKIDPLYLFLLRHESSFSGKIQRGIISGNLHISRNKRRINITLDNVDIKDIPYLKSIGLKGAGMLNVKAVIENNHGDIKFDVNNTQFETFSFSGIAVPMEIFNRAKGLVNIRGDVIEINSFSLEGTDIYGRVKGTIKNNTADLSLEIMPEASARDKFFMLALIEKYKVSPGYYLIPIKTSFSF